MMLTKTDFLDYLKCDKCLWLKKNDPNSYSTVPPTDFEQKNLMEGQEVEEYARKIFGEGTYVGGQSDEAVIKTANLIKKKEFPIFQATFASEKGLLVKVDILDYDQESKSWDIHEVKSSTKIKTDRDHNHIKDVTFQRIVAEESGLPVGNVYIIHLNGEYKKNGELNIESLFVKADVTDDVENALEITKEEIGNALSLIAKKDIDRDSCGCLYLTRTNHCPCFSVFNPAVPDYAVHDIARIRPDKIQALVDSGVLDIKEVSENFDVTEIQRTQVNVAQLKEPEINIAEIEQTLNELAYPLHFIDYETFMSAIPLVDGFSPHQHVPFQVSIHTLENDDQTLSHKEYIADNLNEAVLGFLQFLSANIPQEGSIISWHKSFENGINKAMAELHKEYEAFLLNLVDRTFDLEVPFKKNYLHPGFKGRSSIKSVLPVIVPELSYTELDIQDGASAMEAWRQMVFENLSEDKRKKIKKDLLEYCKMDTLGMVELFKHLKPLS